MELRVVVLHSNLKQERRDEIEAALRTEIVAASSCSTDPGGVSATRARSVCG